MDAQAINREVRDLADVASPELIDTLTEAAEDDEVWTKAASDIKSFLTERGLNVSDSVEITQEQVFLRDAPAPCPESGQVRLGTPGGRVCTKSIQFYVRKPHIQPFPTLKLCVKWETIPWIDAGCVAIANLLQK
jgi:hypothetical protein